MFCWYRMFRSVVTRTSYPASVALKQGVTVLAISRLLGHRKAETSLKYTTKTVGAVLEG